MAINIKTAGVHHVTLRVADFRRARQFYAETLGFPVALEQPDLLVILAGNTAVGIRAPAKGTPKGDTYNPFRVGLDHLAVACQDETELTRVAKALTQAGIEKYWGEEGRDAWQALRRVQRPRSDCVGTVHGV